MSSKKISSKETVTLNEGQIIEAADRLHVANVYIAEVLGDHPLIYAVEEFHEEVEEITRKIGSLYQKIGKYQTIEELAEIHMMKKGYVIKK